MLSTIGYEGANPSDFLQTLKVADVTLIVDVRDRAQSRRVGFSKGSLQKSLGEAGIKYIHLRELGDPKEGREAARMKDFARFRRIYGQVIETIVAKKALRLIVDALENENVCLLCYERDHSHCHRAIVADKVSEITGHRARHLGVARFEQTGQLS